jgi:hypothetical protein
VLPPDIATPWDVGFNDCAFGMFGIIECAAGFIVRATGLLTARFIKNVRFSVDRNIVLPT